MTIELVGRAYVVTIDETAFVTTIGVVGTDLVVVELTALLEDLTRRGQSIQGVQRYAQYARLFDTDKATVDAILARAPVSLVSEAKSLVNRKE